MKEQQLLNFNLPMIQNISFIEEIIDLCHKKTGKDFSIVFKGSDGIIKSIRLVCQGNQKSNNTICFSNLKNSAGIIQNKIIKIFYCNHSGIRIGYGRDKPGDSQTLE